MRCQLCLQNYQVREKTRQIDRCETIFVKIQKNEMEEEKICENFVPT